MINNSQALQDQNWKNLCANHLRDWHGVWTRYSPQGEVIESFQSLRSFRNSLEQTEIFQTNRYMYADGTTKEESWEYNQESNSLPDGHFHPAQESLRGIYFEQGAATWVTRQLKTDSYLGIELFFRYEDLRHSVGIVYDAKGDLMRTASIREDANGYPSQYWSTELDVLPERNLSGSWQGTSITITPDLNVSTPVPTQLYWPWEGNETFFLPDRISVSCPEKISIGTKFTLVANWLVTPSYLQQLIVKYDEQGAFSSVTLELFNLTDELEQ